VVELEARIRKAHPEVSALFVKPQSVATAAQGAKVGTGLSADSPEEIGDG
jgi:hypothetical protein